MYFSNSSETVKILQETLFSLLQIKSKNYLKKNQSISDKCNIEVTKKKLTHYKKRIKAKYLLNLLFSCFLTPQKFFQ